MDELSKGYTEATLINGVPLLIGMNWATEASFHQLAFRLSLRTKAHKEGKHWSSFSEIKSAKDKKTTQYQFCLCEDPESQGAISGALMLADNITKLTGENKGKTTVFIKTIEDELSGFGEQKYWITAISPEGKILSEFDVVVNDRFGLQAVIDDIAITEDIRFALIQEEAELVTFVSQNQDVEIEITQITLADYSKVVTGYNNLVIRVFKPSKIKVKKVGAILGVATTVASLFFSYSYLQQKDAIGLFGDYELAENHMQETRELSDIMKNLKGSSKWTPEEFRKTTLKQFIDSMSDQTQSPLNTALILKEINGSFPTYAADWILSKITYENNSFMVYYTRIPNGKGVYFLLDKKIEMHRKRNPALLVTPFDLREQGTVRVYSVKPNMPLNNQFDSESMLSQLRNEAKVESSYRLSVKRTKDSIAELDSIRLEYSNLTFTNKWIYMKSKGMFERAEEVLVRIESRRSNMIEKKKAFESLKPLQLDESFILGNVMDFVTMMQLDSAFNWSFPSLVRTYPDQNSLNERNPKSSNKKKSKSKGSVYKAAIESYEVKISTQESEEEGKINSYGMSDMIQLGLLINKPFVQVKSVVYNREDDQWLFTIHFNKKTEEYNAKIAKQN